MKLLIVEDADAVRLRLADALGELSGIDVASCAPRAGGIAELISDLEPAVVIIDIQMPGGALDLIRSIKSAHHAPVVMALSSSSSIQYRAACHGSGAEYFFDMARDQDLLVQAIVELGAELAGQGPPSAAMPLAIDSPLARGGEEFLR